MRQRVVTLTTDFGLLDPYVGAMKGVLCSLTDAPIIDLSHAIPPFDVEAAAYVVETAAPRFPRFSVHVAVVDPGVGTSRRLLAAFHEERFYLAPDNGLLGFLARGAGAEFREISVPESASPTFHGRDVLAPAAARLANGAAFLSIGRKVDPPPPPPEPVATAEGFSTRVLHVDAFGTLVCALRAEALGGRDVLARVGGKTVGPLRRTFGDVAEGEPLLYVGSSGRLEIAVNRGRADAHFGLGRGAPVEVRFA
jgi:S-adenosylmethionine hydrolase